MFEVGDRVVCIKPFLRESAGPWDEIPLVLPQVGMQYVIFEVSKHPRERYMGLKLVEIKGWFWNADHFRKVTDIEEPKRRVVEVPKELETA